MIASTPLSLLVCFLPFFFASAGGAFNIPKGWKTCRLSDADRPHCVHDAAQTAFKTLMNGGHKELGLPSIDPLFINKMTLTDRGIVGGPLSVRLQLINCTHTGAKSLVIESFAFDCDNLTAWFVASLKDDAVMTGHYNVSGRVLSINLTGSGPAKFVFKKQKFSVKLTMTNVAKSGVSFLKLKGLVLDTENGQVTTKLDNLFNGNKLLGDSMNQVLNENWKELFEELKPSLNREFGRIISIFPVKVFRMIPLDAFCPP